MKHPIVRLILTILLFLAGFAAYVFGKEPEGTVPLSKILGEYRVVPKFCEPMMSKRGKILRGMMVAFARPADHGMVFAAAELDPIMTEQKINEIEKVVILRVTILKLKVPFVVYMSKRGGIICISQLMRLYGVQLGQQAPPGLAEPPSIDPVGPI
jgi:hypothetical protein